MRIREAKSEFHQEKLGGKISQNVAAGQWLLITALAAFSEIPANYGEGR